VLNNMCYSVAACMCHFIHYRAELLIVSQSITLEDYMYDNSILIFPTEVTWCPCEKLYINEI